MPAQYPSINDNEVNLLKKIANNSAEVAGVVTVVGYNGSITTSSLVGKTITVVNGIITSIN